MNHLWTGDCDDDADLRLDDRNQRRYRHEPAAHPHCGDPDHPGCSHCEPEDD